MENGDWLKADISWNCGKNSSREVPVPFFHASPNFTLAVPARPDALPRLLLRGEPCPLAEVANSSALKPGTWTRDGGQVIVCFDLPKGASKLDIS